MEARTSGSDVPATRSGSAAAETGSSTIDAQVSPRGSRITGAWPRSTGVSSASIVSGSSAQPEPSQRARWIAWLRRTSCPAGGVRRTRPASRSSRISSMPDVRSQALVHWRQVTAPASSQAVKRSFIVAFP